MSGGNLAAALLGVAAAAVFTASFALQQRANLEALTARRAGAAAVVRRPEWIAGVALQPPAFALQAVALGLGAFVVVQPALVTQLAFMVPAGAWVLHRRAHRREFVAPVVVIVGLVLSEWAVRPAGGRDVVPLADWAGPLAAALLVFLGALAAGQALPAYRAALRGAAAGTWGAVIGAFANQVVAIGADGARALVTGWATWALVGAGITNFLWVNLALRAGRLASSLATMSAGAAVVSVGFAVTVFDEELALGPVAATLAVTGAAICVAGIAIIARSPSLAALGSAGTAHGHGGTGPTDPREEQVDVGPA